MSLLSQRVLNLTLVVAGFSVSAIAGSFTSVVVYGDSLSDNGNLFAVSGIPGPPYYQGRRSNGPVAVEQLATALGAPLADYAWIGATTGLGNIGDGGTPTALGSFSLPGMQTELAATQGSLGPNINSKLFIVWGGTNDVLAPSPLDLTLTAIISRAVSDEVGIVNSLELLGARNILVPGLPDLGLTPYFRSLGTAAAAQASAASNTFNASLRSSLPSGVLFYDSASLLRALVANPAAYGLTNVTDPCYNGVTVCANPAQYLFYDGLHPTVAANAFVEKGFLAAVVSPEPSSYLLILGGLSVCLAWKRRNWPPELTPLRS